MTALILGKPTAPLGHYQGIYIQSLWGLTPLLAYNNCPAYLLYYKLQCNRLLHFSSYCYIYLCSGAQNILSQGIPTNPAAQAQAASIILEKSPENLSIRP